MKIFSKQRYENQINGDVIFYSIAQILWFEAAGDEYLQFYVLSVEFAHKLLV